MECFGDSPELADELIAFVTDGPKRATAGSWPRMPPDGDPLPRIGAHWVACDGSVHPRVVLRTHELRVGPLDSVDAAVRLGRGRVRPHARSRGSTATAGSSGGSVSGSASAFSDRPGGRLRAVQHRLAARNWLTDWKHSRHPGSPRLGSWPSRPAVALAPGVWRIPLLGDFVNGFMLRDDDGQVTLVDMGVKQSGPKVMAALASIGSGPERRHPAHADARPPRPRRRRRPRGRADRAGTSAIHEDDAPVRHGRARRRPATSRFLAGPADGPAARGRRSPR